MSKGRATSVTLSSPSAARRQTMVRREPSARAPYTLSSLETSTIRLNISREALADRLALGTLDELANLQAIRMQAVRMQLEQHSQSRARIASPRRLISDASVSPRDSSLTIDSRG